MAIAIVVLFSSCQQKEKQLSKDDLIGVYKYVGREGLAIWTEKYFVAAATWRHEPLPVDSTDYYKREYRSIMMEAGTWTMQDSIINCTLLFGKEPSDSATSFRFTCSFRGDTCIFHILKENGEVGGTGASVKLKQSNKQNNLIGVYQYTGSEEGMCALTEDYFIFTARNKNRFSTIDSTDLYINKYKSLFFQEGTYTVQDSIVTSNRLYAKNPSQAGSSYRWAYSFKGDTVATGFVNKNGEFAGWSDYLIKLE